MNILIEMHCITRPVDRLSFCIITSVFLLTGFVRWWITVN